MEPGAFNDTAEFARYLVESFEAGRTSEFPEAFATIERILNEGDQESRDIAGIGVIEVFRRSDQIILAEKLF